GVSAQRVHATAGNTNIAQQQLDHGAGTDDLRTNTVLRPAQRIQDGARATRFSGRGQHFTDFQELVLGRATDAFHHLGRVALVVLAQQLVDRAWVLQGGVRLDVAVLAQLVVPGGLVVAAFFFVVARIQPLLEVKVFAHDKRSEEHTSEL